MIQGINILPRKKKKCKTEDKDRGERREARLSQGLLVSGFRVPASFVEPVFSVQVLCSWLPGTVFRVPG